MFKRHFWRSLCFVSRFGGLELGQETGGIKIVSTVGESEEVRGKWTVLGKTWPKSCSHVQWSSMTVTFANNSEEVEGNAESVSAAEIIRVKLSKLCQTFEAQHLDFWFAASVYSFPFSAMKVLEAFRSVQNECFAVFLQARKSASLLASLAFQNVSHGVFA